MTLVLLASCMASLQKFVYYEDDCCADEDAEDRKAAED